MPDGIQDRESRRAFFGRRKGHKLRASRSSLMASLLPELALDIARPAPADLTTLFRGTPRDVALEIGFGGGENFAREAAAAPARGFIGCEPFVNGMASALALVETHKLTNVILHHGDAIEVLDWLPASSVVQVDLLYPDPWPKKRHWKRRFVSDESLAQLARVIARGGIFRFATDIEHYTEWTLLRVLRSRAFQWTAERADDWRKPWPGYGGTRYEAKALREGRTPNYLIFRRV